MNFFRKVRQVFLLNYNLCYLIVFLYYFEIVIFSNLLQLINNKVQVYEPCTFRKNILDGIAFSAIRGYLIVNIEDTKIKPSNKTQKRARNSGMQTITNFNKYAWYIISLIFMTNLSLKILLLSTTFRYNI